MSFYGKRTLAIDAENQVAQLRMPGEFEKCAETGCDNQVSNLGQDKRTIAQDNVVLHNVLIPRSDHFRQLLRLGLG